MIAGSCRRTGRSDELSTRLLSVTTEMTARDAAGSGVDADAALEFIKDHRWATRATHGAWPTAAVMTTLRRNGRPQISNVGYVVLSDGLIQVSITADRAKYHNLLGNRGPRCTSAVRDSSLKYSPSAMPCCLP